MMTMWFATVVIGGTLLGMLGPAPAGAQTPTPEVEVAVPAPARPEPEFRLEPTAPPEQTGVREQDFHQGLIRSRHDPVFVQPLVGTAPVSRTTAIKFGLSGWTAPAPPGVSEGPAGSGAAFGLTIQWGVPVPAEPPSPPPSQR
jgi:hypothetical protein